MPDATRSQIPRRTLLHVGAGIGASLLLLSACTAEPSSLDVANTNAVEFFRSFLPGEFLDITGEPQTLEALVGSVEAVVLGRVTDVIHSYSTQEPGESIGLHTLSIAVSGSVRRGQLRGNPSRLLVVGGTTSSSPADFVAQRRQQLPAQPVLWFVSAYESLAEQRHEEMLRAGMTLDPAMLAEEAKLTGLFAAGPFGIISQGSEHVEFPGLPEEFANHRLVRELAAIPRLSELVATLR